MKHSKVYLPLFFPGICILLPPRQKKVHLCQEQDDWEIVRAAIAALSVAAYHEANAYRMGKIAPDLIPVLVSLLPHPDAEVQAHAATALANLTHKSSAHQSEAGEVGAIEALLDLCRGRAGNDRESLRDKNCDIVALGGEVHGSLVADGSKDFQSSTEGATEKKGEVDKQWVRKRGSVKNVIATATTATTATTAMMPGMRVAKELRTLETSMEEQEELTPRRNKRDGEDGVVDTMDVDAVQAATAALANLLCYSESNSIKLVAAGGIGVLVGLVSSYRPQNLLNSDQVCS